MHIHSFNVHTHTLRTRPKVKTNSRRSTRNIRHTTPMPTRTIALGIDVERNSRAHRVGRRLSLPRIIVYYSRCFCGRTQTHECVCVFDYIYFSF